MATDFTDRIGQRLDDPASVPPEYQHLIQDDIERVHRILEIEVHGRILDVGCSDGAIAKRIAKVWEVDITGCDTRPVTGLGWQFHQHDMRQPWPPPLGGPFDAVYACEVLEHLTDADVSLALTNMLAVLKPGGRLIVTVPNRHPHDLYEVGCRSRWAWPDHRSSWTRRKVEHVLGVAGVRDLVFVPIYPDERPEDSIWLLAHGVRR